MKEEESGRLSPRIVLGVINWRLRHSFAHYQLGFGFIELPVFNQQFPPC